MSDQSNNKRGKENDQEKDQADQVDVLKFKESVRDLPGTPQTNDAKDRDRRG